MNQLSDQAKEELLHALEGKQSDPFVIEGKLVSVEVENFEPVAEDNPDMKGYTASELKEKRRGRRN